MLKKEEQIEEVPKELQQLLDKDKEANDFFETPDFDGTFHTIH